ncbi:hypothetical protein PT974_04490 [Cladobotryum mycophilum]|uniref:Uncharacterized protein n=1 Tax=Cladobotryum mycophilum TaxID=491253 RepID=A0ABR0SVB6_9HYPO
MLFKYFLAFAATGLINHGLADGGRPCGLKIARCPQGNVCVPDNPKCTDLNRCRGTCTPDHCSRPCGFKIAPCPQDMACIPNSPACTDLNNCLGTCTTLRKYPPCGGHRPDPPQCDKQSVCIDDLRVPGSCGMKCDAPGICVSKKVSTCGGIAGRRCPKGLDCYDDPRDECDPTKGGRDCTGICL